MHELGRFIQGLMDGRGWTQADLARASGITRQTVSRLLIKDHLGRMVSDETIAGLHKAFPEVSEGAFITKAAEALGVPIDRLETVDPDVSQLSDEALLGILAGRLKERRSADGRQPDAEKSEHAQPAAEAPLTFAERRRQRMIDQAQPIQEAAYDQPIDVEPEDEDFSQDPDDWGQDEGGRDE